MEYKNFKEIPNLDFLSTVCKYHTMYEKSRKCILSDPLNNTNMIDEIITYVNNK